MRSISVSGFVRRLPSGSRELTQYGARGQASCKPKLLRV